MLHGMKSLIDRTAGTALDDALGIVALFAILLAGLSMPGL
jgi:hypothetical protein